MLSTTTTPWNPRSALPTPPTAGPIRRARPPFSVSREFAVFSSFSSTSRGMSALRGGAKNSPIDICRKLTTSAIQTWSGDCIRRSGSSRHARRRSAALIIRLRSHRASLSGESPDSPQVSTQLGTRSGSPVRRPRAPMRRSRYQVVGANLHAGLLAVKRLNSPGEGHAATFGEVHRWCASKLIRDFLATLGCPCSSSASGRGRARTARRPCLARTACG